MMVIKSTEIAGGVANVYRYRGSITVGLWVQWYDSTFRCERSQVLFS